MFLMAKVVLFSQPQWRLPYYKGSCDKCQNNFHTDDGFWLNVSNDYPSEFYESWPFQMDNNHH
uniref:Uncharacterized protein n=1 Tax=Tetranychus urticae TaxID=32264 RepID=T1KX02_TETUR